MRRDSAFLGKDLVDFLARDREIVVSEGLWKDVLAVRRDVWILVEKMSREPYSLGLTIGEIRGKSFLPGLELAYIASKRGGFLGAIVGGKGAEAFLYGRNVLLESLLEFVGEPRKGDRVLVLNEDLDPLGIGLLLVDPSDVIDMRKKGGKVEAIRNLIDRGWYLRRGG